MRFSMALMSYGFPRLWEGKMPGGIPLICLLVFTLAGHTFAAQWDREGAESALTQAREFRSQLADTQSLNKSDYLRCIRAYKRVWLNDPHYSGCDDAIYEAALLYQEMSEKFKAPEYLQESADLLRFLVRDYTVSPFRRDARTRLAALEGRPPDSAQPATAQAATEPPAAAGTAPQAPPPRAQPVPPPAASPADGATAVSAPRNGPAVVQNIRHWSSGDRTRVMIDVDGPVRFQSGKVENPDRLFFDLSNTELSRELTGKTIAVGDTFLKQIRTGRNKPGVARVVLDLGQASEVSISQLENPFRIVIDIRTPGTPAAPAQSASAKPAPASEPPAKQAARPEKIESLAARTDPAASGKDQPLQVPAGPKPGEKVVIDATPLFPAPARQADAAATQKSSPPPSAQIPVQAPPRPNGDGKETASLRADTGMSEKVQPPSVAQKPVETGPVPRPAASPVTNGSTAGVLTPSPTDPAAKSLQTARVLPVPAADASLKKSATDRTAAAEPSSGSDGTRDTSPPARRASPTSKGDMTMTRVLGLKVGRIVIDPGHGGHDTGTVGRNGLMEKNLVLDVALTLKKSLEDRLGAQVLMTRSDDRFVSLEERTAIANRHKGDLFVSIHANASTSRSTSGVETYYLNFARTAADREIAARENATTLMSIGELQDLVRKIAMADKSTESRELAGLMQRSLYSGSRVIFPKSRNRGVRSAPFVVLIGAEMPAVLVEVAFISNPRDEKLLKKENNHQVLAQALLTGIEGYLKSLASYMADNHPGSN